MSYRKGTLSAIIAGALALGILAGASSIERVMAAGDAGPNTSCSGSSPCQSYDNTGTGPGLESSSTGGSGLTGTTTLIGSGSNNGAGVLGTDASTSGTADSGVKGTSNKGTGVSGTSKNGTGVKGTSTKGSGVVGTTSNGVGLAAVVGTSTSSTGIGVDGTAPLLGVEGTGLVGVLAAEQGQGIALQMNGDGSGGSLMIGRAGGTVVYTLDESGNEFPASVTTAGNVSAGVILAHGPSGNVGLDSSENTTEGFAAIEADANTSPGNLYDGFDDNFDPVYVVDSFGNIRIAGNIFTAGSCNSGCIQQKNGGRRVVSYTPRESQPTMEDFGSAQLVHGHVHVALSPDFSNVINRGAGYLVFLTPDGDCNGLFVADKTAQGFDVGELHGGTSDVAFDYRIVAKPFGDRSARLPMVDMGGVRAAAVSKHRIR